MTDFGFFTLSPESDLATGKAIVVAAVSGLVLLAEDAHGS